MMTENQKRYVGLDVHKHYLMVGAINAAQEMVMPPRRVSLLEFEGWAKKHLRSTDEVVLKATTNAWCHRALSCSAQPTAPGGWDLA
jgi:hypothetical protein